MSGGVGVDGSWKLNEKRKPRWVSKNGMNLFKLENNVFTKKLHKVISCSLSSVRIDTEYNNGKTNTITYYN